MEQPYRSYYTAMMPFPGRAVLPIDLAGLSGTAGGGGGASPMRAHLQPDMAGVCATITTDGGQVLHSDGTEWGVLPTPQCGFHELMLAHLNDSPELSPPLEEDTGFMLDLLRSSSLTELTTLGTSTLPPAPQPGQVQVSQAHALCSLQQLPLPLSSNILPPPEPEAEAETQAKAEPQTKADVQAATDGVAAMEIGDKGEAEAAQQEAKPQEGHASSPGGSGRSCGTTQAWDSVGHAPITPSAGPAPSSSTAGTQGSAESTGGLQAGQAGQAAREDENPRQAKKPRLGQRLYRASQLTLEILEERGCFDYTLDEAAHMLGFGSPTTLKKEMARLGLKKWPYRKRETFLGMLNTLEDHMGRYGRACCDPRQVDALLALVRRANAEVRTNPTDSSPMSKHMSDLRQRLYKLVNEKELIDAANKWEHRVRQVVEWAVKTFSL